MLTTNESSARTNEVILRELERAVLLLADAVEGEPPISAALRRFASSLPAAPLLPPAPPSHPATPPRRIREVLYHALDEGALDARRFDWLMLAERRARRHRSARGEARLPG